MIALILQLLPIATVHSEIVDFVTIPPSIYGSSAANFSAASFVVNTNSAVMCNYVAMFVMEVSIIS